MCNIYKSMICEAARQRTYMFVKLREFIAVHAVHNYNSSSPRQFIAIIVRRLSFVQFVASVLELLHPSCCTSESGMKFDTANPEKNSAERRRTCCTSMHIIAINWYKACTTVRQNSSSYNHREDGAEGGLTRELRNTFSHRLASVWKEL